MRNRTVWIAVVLLMALGACGDGDSEADLPSGVDAAIDGFTAAVNNYDTAAITAHVAEDFTWQSTGSVQPLAEYVAYVDAYYRSGDFHYEPTGERVWDVEGDGYMVEEPGLVTGEALGPNGLIGVTVYRVVAVDGSWFVEEARWLTEPADESG